MGQGKCVMTGMKTFRRDPAATAFAAAFALLPSSAAVMFYSQGFFLGPVTAEFGRTRSEFMGRSEEHTSELQSLMRISYAVFCLKQKHKRKMFRSTPSFSLLITTYSITKN